MKVANHIKCSEGKPCHVSCLILKCDCFADLLLICLLAVKLGPALENTHSVIWWRSSGHTYIPIAKWLEAQPLAQQVRRSIPQFGQKC